MKADVAEYAEFRVALSGGADRECTVDVVDSPAGEATEHGLNFPLDPLAAQSALAGAARATRGWVQRKVASDSLDPLRDIGSRLFSWLFGRRLLNLYRRSLDMADQRSQGLRLRLRLDSPELMAVPWEFLYDGRDFVALSNRSPVVREVPAQKTPVHVAPIKSPLRVLMVCDARLSALLEGGRDWLTTLRRQGLPLEWDPRQDVLENATWRQLLEAMARKPYHILHYIHASPDLDWSEFTSLPGRVVLQLVREDGGPDLITLERWMQGISNRQHLRLIYLASDETSRSAADLAALVPAVVGVMGGLTLDANSAFDWGLYQAILAGKPLDAAVTQGRREIDQQVPGSREWGLPVFYMQTPDGTFLASSETASTKPFVSTTPPGEEPSLSDPELRRQWKLLQSKLAIARGNLEALERQLSTGAASAAVVDSEIRLMNDQIAELQQELDEMTR